MIFQYTVLFCTFIGALVFAAVFKNRQRNFLMPFCIAYIFALQNTIGAIGGILHFLGTSFNFVIVMMLCNGFPRRDCQNNPSWNAWIVFYFYLTVIVFTGYFPGWGFCEYAQTFMNRFCAGFFLAMWIMRTEGSLKRVYVAVLVAALISIAYYAVHGGFDMAQIAETGRAGFEEDYDIDSPKANVNHIALGMSCFLPFLLDMFMRSGRTGGAKFFKIVSGAAFVFVALIIIRTGSRNGALALIPCAWYFVKGGRGTSKKIGQLCLGAVALIMLFVGIRLTMGGAEIRAFDFSQKTDSYDSVLDSVSTGRIGFYQSLYDQMTPVERIIGKGFTMTDSLVRFDKLEKRFVKIDRPRSFNAHSMYVSIFVRSGVIGCLLFLVFVIVSFKQSKKLGERGKLGMLFMGVWLATGVGEAWGMIGGATALLAGIAIGFFSNQRAMNSEFGEIPYWNRNEVYRMS